MATIDRLTCVWSGYPGLPGYSNFYFTNAAGTAAKLDTFFNGFAGYLGQGITITIPASGDTFDAATGALVGDWSYSGGSTVAGQGTSNHAGPVGAVINWKTNGINRARKVRGKTFLVPLYKDAYDEQGTLAAAVQAAIQNAADVLVASAAPVFVVWSRPRLGTGGTASEVTSAKVPDLAAVLRSRRA